MNIYKNPFAIRASERIETDEMFLELFSSEPLTHLEEKFEQDKLWNNVTTILSSPGAGKTTDHYPKFRIKEVIQTPALS